MHTRAHYEGQRELTEPKQVEEKDKSLHGYGDDEHNEILRHIPLEFLGENARA